MLQNFRKTIGYEKSLIIHQEMFWNLLIKQFYAFYRKLKIHDFLEVIITVKYDDSVRFTSNFNKNIIKVKLD